jgi:membrane peptidoglycan carboxypeptidase
LIDEKSVVDDQGTLKVGDYAYANWYFTQYGRVEGSVNVQKALARSNDIFFYKAAEWLGPSKLAEYARLLVWAVRLECKICKKLVVSARSRLERKSKRRNLVFG